MSAFLANKFREYDRENPEIYEKFCEYANEASAVTNKFSARIVVERIRWFAIIEVGNKDGFKINNNYIAYYARKYMREHPWVPDTFFETREV